MNETYHIAIGFTVDDNAVGRLIYFTVHASTDYTPRLRFIGMLNRSFIHDRSIIYRVNRSNRINGINGVYHGIIIPLGHDRLGRVVGSCHRGMNIISNRIHFLDFCSLYQDRLRS